MDCRLVHMVRTGIYELCKEQAFFRIQLSYIVTITSTDSKCSRNSEALASEFVYSFKEVYYIILHIISIIILHI